MAFREISGGLPRVPGRIDALVRLGAVDGHSTMKDLLHVIPLPLLIAACACGYRHSRPVIESGRDFPCRSAIGLEGEPTPDEVIRLIGGPLERRPVQGGEIFRYSVRVRYGDHVKLFGLITLSEPHYSWSCDVRLEFRGGHLYSIAHTMENNGPDGEEKDGPSTRILREQESAK